MKELELRVDVFFCHRIDPKQDTNRRPLEKELGDRIRFFPLPCGSRIETVHLLRSLESGADKAYLLVCPPGMCRHQILTGRAAKRLAYARELIAEFGLEKDRIELVISDCRPTSIDSLVRSLLEREATVARSPLNDEDAAVHTDIGPVRVAGARG